MYLVTLIVTRPTPTIFKNLYFLISLNETKNGWNKKVNICIFPIVVNSCICKQSIWCNWRHMIFRVWWCCQCRHASGYVERVLGLQRALGSLQQAADRRELTERKLRAQLEKELQTLRYGGAQGPLRQALFRKEKIKQYIILSSKHSKLNIYSK